MSHTHEFDQTLITAAFTLAAENGWGAVSVASAARAASLDLAQARARFSGNTAILRRFGALADHTALLDFFPAATVRETLFDLLMRRFDDMGASRLGLAALLRALPADPATTMILTDATARSMGWMLEAAGVSTSGFRGAMRVKGLVAVWLYAFRAFVGDDSPDLSATMAALDRALSHAERAASWLESANSAPKREPQPFPEPEDESFIGPSVAT